MPSYWAEFSDCMDPVHWRECDISRNSNTVEVYDYVTRETIILTVIGIIIGLVVGYFLNMYILGTCEINILRFENTIHPLSYVYATAITIVFSITVNIVTYFALKKIDMIGSLKSVE